MAIENMKYDKEIISLALAHAPIIALTNACIVLHDCQENETFFLT